MGHPKKTRGKLRGHRLPEKDSDSDKKKDQCWAIAVTGGTGGPLAIAVRRRHAKEYFSIHNFITCSTEPTTTFFTVHVATDHELSSPPSTLGDG